MTQTILVDQFSFAAAPIEMFFDRTPLSLGTAFVWEENSQFFLITNWHNVTGKNPLTGKHLSPTAAEPNQVQVWLNTKAQLGAKDAFRLPLRDGNGTPRWFVHPSLRESVDAVALPLKIPPNVEPFPINRMPNVPDLDTRVGHDVFILGYPLGITPGGIPIWKRASIASEPDLLDPSDPRLLVDTASRPGMSGSPVIRRTWGMAQLTNGSLNLGPSDHTRVVGIYSGRLTGNEPIDAQLGLVWPIELVSEIIAGRQLDH